MASALRGRVIFQQKSCVANNNERQIHTKMKKTSFTHQKDKSQKLNTRPEDNVQRSALKICSMDYSARYKISYYSVIVRIICLLFKCNKNKLKKIVQKEGVNTAI